MINAGQQVVPLTSLDPVFADFALAAAVSCRQLSDGPGSQGEDRRGLPGQVFNGKLTAIELDGRFEHAQRLVPGDAGNADRALATGNVRESEVTLPRKNKTLVIPAPRFPMPPSATRFL